MIFLNKSFPDDIKSFDFKSPHIHTFQPKEAHIQPDKKSIRYHYTSANALMTILNAQQNGYGKVRFTDSRFMNDRSEHLFFIKRLLEYIGKHRNNYPFCEEVINKLLLQNHTEDDYISLRVSEIEETKMDVFQYVKSRHFLFCMCNKDDSLQMWNYYIHNGNYQGYNIGIKIFDFLKNFDSETTDNNDPIRFYCGNVLYKKGQQEKEIELLCNFIENFGEKFADTPYAFQFAMARLWMYIDCYGLFFKDERFSEEKEYRIVIQFEEPLAGCSISSYFKSNDRKIEYSFFERNGILVPCLLVPLAQKAVKQITIAPIMENQIAFVSLQEYIEANGYSAVDVKQSTIPIRF